MSLRVTDSYLSSIMVGDLNRSLGALLKAQRTAGTMHRVNSFADDPRLVSSIQRYHQLITLNDQYRNNVARSRTVVDTTDSSLQTISDVLADVRVISLREASALGTAQTMATATVEVDNEVNRLLDVLNTTVEGTYIFGGMQTSSPPFERLSGGVTYRGDEQEMLSRTGPNSLIPINIPGKVFVGNQSSSLGGKVDLAPRLQGTTSLTDLNLGDGWNPGSITLRDGEGNGWSVDLSSALTVDDVINTINTATGGAITAGINASGTALEFNGTGPLTIADDGGTQTAASLGINATSDGGTLTGNDVRPAAQATTNLSDIQALAGNLPLGSIKLDWKGTSYTVDLSTAVTLGDLKSLIETAVPGMELQIQNSAIMFVGGSPDNFEISNADASSTASLLGVVGTGTPVRLFGMLDDLKTALQAGDQAGVRGILTELQSLQDMVSRQMILNGGRQKDLDAAEVILQSRDERLRSSLSLEYDADTAQVATDLSRAQTSYQASLSVTSQLFRYNLIQFLR